MGNFIIIAIMAAYHINCSYHMDYILVEKARRQFSSRAFFFVWKRS
jgi:hypothetical protein